MKKHISVCNACGTEAASHVEYPHVVNPAGWSVLKPASLLDGDEIDLCPRCTQIVRKLIEGWRKIANG